MAKKLMLTVNTLGHGYFHSCMERSFINSYKSLVGQTWNYYHQH